MISFSRTKELSAVMKNSLECVDNQNVKMIIKQLLVSQIKKCDVEGESILDKVHLLREDIIQYIELEIYKYRKDDLLIGLLSLKSSIHMEVSTGEEAKFIIGEEYKWVLSFIKLLLQLEDNNFMDAKCENNDEKLSIVFALIRVLETINDNYDHYIANDIGEKYDISFFLKEGSFYSEKFNQYMNDFYNIPKEQRPEQNNLEIDLFIKTADNREASKSEIDKCIEKVTIENMGFSVAELQQFITCNLEEIMKNELSDKSKWEQFLICKFDKMSNSEIRSVGDDMFREFMVEFVALKNPFILINKNEYYSVLEQKYRFSKDSYNNIINMFSLKKLNIRHCESTSFIELKSILEVEEDLLFYPFDFLQIYSEFNSFLYKGHFIDYYINDYDREKYQKVRRELDEYEDKISTYLACVLGEILYKEGYDFLVDNGEVMSIELSDLVIDHTKNLLKGNGDIDILAIDRKSKKILNVEVKNYKPLIHICKDNGKIEERRQHMSKVLARENILENNIKDVLGVFSLKEDEHTQYNVESILVTVRPDYWLTNEQMNIKYLNWVDFISLARKHSL